LKAREGDQVTLRAPGGDEILDIVQVVYRAIDLDDE
jgi:transcription elongation GreA/GreB family factor